MLVVLVIFSVGLLGVIVYFAVSRRSSRLLRLAAIGALALICVSLVISGILLFRGPDAGEMDIPLPVLDNTAPQVRKSGNLTDLLIIVGLVIVLSAVIYKAFRDQKKTAAESKAAVPEFHSSGSFDDFELSKTDKKDDDEESFDIEIE